ncbi:rod-binding protein [Jhaorihella thermophila]|uniref:Rod binding protein n=1 Tax=Jhaorihella thermophila TaxID=488547 RepID=A0A1H5U4J0_9RHOB|nr:rod-binding protein [Jhaorihella thermophila]SEF69956.1 Rod binding protein [Jhaorihella thermophila]
MESPITNTVPPGQTTRPERLAELRQAATEFEAAFLAEALKSAGLGKSRSDFGGGVGEDQFQDFLVRAQADELARNGGIGVADIVFRALMEKENGKQD